MTGHYSKNFEIYDRIFVLSRHERKKKIKSHISQNEQFTLENQRKVAGSFLLFKVTNNLIDNLPLLQLINFNTCSYILCTLLWLSGPTSSWFKFIVINLISLLLAKRVIIFRSSWSFLQDLSIRMSSYNFFSLSVTVYI